MQSCWEIKGCPASHYVSCPAFEKQVSCWETKKGCLCHVYLTCESCPIFVQHPGEREQDGKEEQDKILEE